MMRRFFAGIIAFVCVVAMASAAQALSPLDAIRLYSVQRGFGNFPVTVVSMQQSGNAISADVTMGETGTTMFLVRTAQGWSVVGGSDGGPATLQRMVSAGVPVGASRVLVAHRGTSLLSPRHAVTLHPLHDLVRRGLLHQ